MDEFECIASVFKPLSIPGDDLDLGIGDDAAAVGWQSQHQLLVATDTLVEGVHFLPSWQAHAIAYKALTVNISDIAAMGGEPLYYSLALTLDSMDSLWLKGFSQGLKAAGDPYALRLIGGDTTRGPKTITISILGRQVPSKILRRSGARVGDKIILSGPIGAAGLAVAHIENRQALPPALNRQALARLLYPTARVAHGQCLAAIANAAIDISDGLSADLNHILVASGVGATLELDQLPMHSTVEQTFDFEQAWQHVLRSGDDYELCICIPKERWSEAQEALDAQGLDYYCIGQIEAQSGLRAKHPCGKLIEINPQGYQHF